MPFDGPAEEWSGTTVSRFFRCHSTPNIFVLGDTAALTQNGKPLPGVAQVAIQQGEYAAAVIAARVAGKEHKQPFHYRNKGMLATIGRSYAIADLGLIRLAGFPAKLIWAFVFLMGNDLLLRLRQHSVWGLVPQRIFCALASVLR
jgi:NADH:quinone reductase (non-electrogenic)